MKVKGLKRACLAVGLALAAVWFAPLAAHAMESPPARTFHIKISPNQAMSDVYFLYSSYNTDKLTFFQSATKLEDDLIPGGVSHTCDFVAQVGSPGAVLRQFAIIGLYDANCDGVVNADDGGKVSICLNEATAAYALEGDETSPGCKGWADVLVGYTEQQIAAALASGNPDFTLENFAKLNQDSFASLDGKAVLVNFSSATAGGTVEVSEVPEASGLITLFGAAIGICGARRRK